MLTLLLPPTLGFGTVPLQLRPMAPFSSHPRSAAPLSLEVSDTIEFAEHTLAAVEGHGVLSRTDNCLRVTASDVASASGTSIDSASVALAALTAEVPGASMEVMRQGQMLYVFPRDCRRRWRSSAAPRSSAVDRMRARVQRVARSGVGWLLLGSVAAVRPLTGGRTVQATAAECFSFLLGDGGADVAALEALQWQMIAAAIRANKGAVVAEQLLPFLLDVRARGAAAALKAARQPRPGRASAEAEAGAAAELLPLPPFMLPVLARFGGVPQVSSSGEVVYLFPELLPSAAAPASWGHFPTHAPLVRGATAIARSFAGPDAATDYLLEPTVRFAPQGARGVLRVALANLLGCVLLGGLLGPAQLVLRGRAGAPLAGVSSGLLLRLINACYGALLLNGVLWVGLPALRRLRLLGTNWALFHRNRVRRRHAALLLRPLPPPPLARKLEAARKRRHRAKPTVGGEVYYSSAKSLLEQAEVHNPPLEAWDDALRRRNRSTRT